MEINSKGKEVSLSEVESVHRKKCDKILEKSDEGGALFEGGMKKRLQVWKMRRAGLSSVG